MPILKEAIRQTTPALAGLLAQNLAHDHFTLNRHGPLIHGLIQALAFLIVYFALCYLLGVWRPEAPSRGA